MAITFTQSKTKLIVLRRVISMMFAACLCGCGISNVAAQEFVLSEQFDNVGEIDLGSETESDSELRGIGLTTQLLNQEQLDDLLHKVPVPLVEENAADRNPLRSMDAAITVRPRTKARPDSVYLGSFKSQPTVVTQRSAWRRDAAVRPVSFDEPMPQEEIVSPSKSGFVVNQKQKEEKATPPPSSDDEAPILTPAIALPTQATSLKDPLPSSTLETAVATEANGDSDRETESATPPQDAFIGPAVPESLKIRWKAGDDLVQMTVTELSTKIQQRKQAIEALPNSDDAIHEQRLQKLASAVEAIAIANQNVSEESNLKVQIADLDTEIANLNQRLNAPPDTLAVDAGLGVEQLQSVLKNLEADLEETKADAGRVQDLMEKRDQRMARIPVERIEYRKQLNELHEKIQLEKTRGMDDLTTLYDLRAQELQASTAVSLLEQESKWYSLSRSLLPLRRDLQLKQIRTLETEVVKWSEAIDRGRRRELEEQVRIATNNAYNSEPALKAFNEATIELTSSRKTLQDKLSDVQKEKILVSAQKKDLKKQISSIESAIDVGSNAGSGTLINIHQTLVRPYEGMARVQYLKRELQESKIAILKLRQQREQFGDVESFITEELGIVNDVVIPHADKTLKAMAREAIEIRKQQIDALSGENEAYKGLLAALVSERESVLAQIAETRRLVETHALWTQSAAPIGVEVMMEAQLGARKFFAPQQWSDLAESVVGRMRTRPYESVVGVLGLLIAFVVGHKLKN